jgi:hypothetical protein
VLNREKTWREKDKNGGKQKRSKRCPRCQDMDVAWYARTPSNMICKFAALNKIGQCFNMFQNVSICCNTCSWFQSWLVWIYRVGEAFKYSRHGCMHWGVQFTLSTAMASLGGTRRTEQFDQIDGNSKIFQDNPFEPRVDWFESVPVWIEEKKNVEMMEEGRGSEYGCPGGWAQGTELHRSLESQCKCK